MVKKEAHLGLKAYIRDVLNRGFQRPEYIPVYVDENLTTWRESEESRPNLKKRKQTMTHVDNREPLLELTSLSINNAKFEKDNLSNTRSRKVSRSKSAKMRDDTNLNKMKI